jgi:hypothetical protein
MDNIPFESIGVSLPSDLLNWVRQTAQREDRSVSGLIRRVLSEAASRGPLPAPPTPRKVLQQQRRSA